MSYPHEQFLSFDLETASHEDRRFALQPFRCTEWRAEITTYAISWFDFDETAGKWRVKSTGRIKPERAQLAEVLHYAIDTGRTIVGWNVSFDAAWLVAMGLYPEVIQAKWSDAMLLWQHLERGPEYGKNADHRRSYSLKEAVRQYMPKYAGYEDDVDYQDTSPEGLRRLLKYNRRDTNFTLLLHRLFYRKLKEQDPRQLRNAQIEAAAIPPVANTMVQGLCVDTDAAHTLDSEIEKGIDKLYAGLKLSGADDKILASPIKLRKLIYQDWGLRVTHTTPKGDPSTDKVALHWLAAQDPRARTIKEYRELRNNRTKFVEKVLDSVEYNGDGRTRPGARIYGTYCVPGDTEVLTREGWVPLSDWSGGDIMQYDPDTGRGHFLHADRYVGPEVSDWIAINTRGVQCLFTYGHTVGCFGQTGKWGTLKAGELLDRVGALQIPTAVDYLGAHVDPKRTRVIVMAQADGWFDLDKGTLKFTLKKRRKVTRCKELLDAAGVPYREYICPAYPDRTEITVNKRTMPDWLGPWCKTLGPWVLNHDAATFTREAERWDGYIMDGGLRAKVTFKSREDAKWLRTMAALAGFKASIHAPETQSHGGSTHTVHISRHRAVSTVVPKKHVAAVQHTERAYCAVSQTGFWLARSGDTVFVTGNTGRMTFASKQGRGKEEVQTGFAIHQMKSAPEYRRIITAPPGYVLCEWDAAGQEYRWMAVESGDETMQSLCMPGEDPHSYMGSGIAHLPYEDIMALQEESDDHKQARKMGKVGNLSCQFRIGWKKLHVQANVQFGMPLTPTEAQLVHRTYHSTYPGVKQYWLRQINKAKRLGYVETLAGRRVQLDPAAWNHPDLGWKQESTAVNFPIQGIGADQKYLAIKVLMTLLPKWGGYYYFELHDGLYAILPEKVAMKAGLQIRDTLSRLPYKKAWGFEPPVPMPWDFKVGPNWGDMKEIKDE